MITITNKQRMPIDLKLLHKQTAYILQELGYADFEVNILIASEPAIAKYNARYRSKNRPTDVLSFPYHEIKPGKKFTCDPDVSVPMLHGKPPAHAPVADANVSPAPGVSVITTFAASDGPKFFTV